MASKAYIIMVAILELNLNFKGYYSINKQSRRSTKGSTSAFTGKKTGKKIMVREKSGNFIFGPKVREESGNFVLNCRLPCKFAVILVDYRECLSRYSPI